MKKLSIFIVVMLLASSFATLGVGAKTDEKLEAMNISFSEPKILEKEAFMELKVQGTNNYIFDAGKPMLPVYTKCISLPFGVKIKDVVCEAININSMSLNGKIKPAPLPQRKDIVKISKEKIFDEKIYSSDDLFPPSWYSYHVGVGLDSNMKHKTLVTVNIFPVRYSPGTDTFYYSKDFDLKIIYTGQDPNIFPANSDYDLVIIAPSYFSNDLQPLVDHKNSFGVKTVLKTTEEIYSAYSGVDKPEQIKYFIKDAIENWGVKYVLLVGGLKSLVYAKPRDDRNQGSEGWHLPVRYSNFLWDGNPYYNFTSGEPGYLCDLYFADIYKEGGVFDDWDSNNDGIFAEWAGDIKDELDLYPDVAVGRLACRNNNEVKTVVNKIIKYETSADPSWFKKILVVSGDGFLDQHDLNIQWDTNDLPNGEYTVYAQSTNPDDLKGPIEEVHITIDKTQSSKLTFNHEDHLKPGYKDYPAAPITEIVTIADGDILGKDDFTYTPTDREAYCNDLYWWANISYVDGVLTIRGKSYDPEPYGNLTNMKLWIENSNGETIFTAFRNNTETYYEGEWVTGEKLLRGRGGALYYMPDDFEKNIVWTSNGKWVTQDDVISEFSKGYGLAYFSGHGSPGWWGDHYPGIPGNRRYAQVPGLVVTQISPYFPFFTKPVFPMNKLSNTDKLPVVCVGGCHNSMFNISLILTFLDGFIPGLYMHTYGRPTPECWGWYMVKLPKTGAIATMGNSGYGWGSEGDVCTIGTGDAWINTEFFRQYGTEGHHILGEAYIHAISSYINNHKTLELHYWRSDYGWDGIDEKTVQQWILLGDPSLKIGGYNTQSDVSIDVIGSDTVSDGKPNEGIKIKAVAKNKPVSYTWDLDGDGVYDDATGETITGYYDKPGAYWVDVKAIYDDKEVSYKSVVYIDKDKLPDKPSRPSGASSIRVGKEYTYSTSANDFYNDTLYYLFNWSDGEFDVIGPVSSGKEVRASHKWKQNGSYEVKVIAFDSYGQWSGWSDSLLVSVSKDKLYLKTPLLQRFLEQYPQLAKLLQLPILEKIFRL